jgi:hypothetical protein
LSPERIKKEKVKKVNQICPLSGSFTCAMSQLACKVRVLRFSIYRALATDFKWLYALLKNCKLK